MNLPAGVRLGPATDAVADAKIRRYMRKGLGVLQHPGTPPFVTLYKGLRGTRQQKRPKEGDYYLFAVIGAAETPNAADYEIRGSRPVNDAVSLIGGRRESCRWQGDSDVCAEWRCVGDPGGVHSRIADCVCAAID